MRVQVTIISRRRCNRENRVRNSCTSREHNGSLKISQRAYRSVIIIVIGITIPLSALSSNLGCDFRRDMWRVVLISKIRGSWKVCDLRVYFYYRKRIIYEIPF